MWICYFLQVSHIDPGSPIKLHLYAENAKGTSEPAIIDDALSTQHKHYVEGKYHWSVGDDAPHADDGNYKEDGDDEENGGDGEDDEDDGGDAIDGADVD